MIVYQCNSCKATTSESNTLTILPTSWTRITLDGQFKLTYDLCDECSHLPMRFGLIEFNRD